MWSWTGLRAGSRSSNSARGFTLIEVLVAFAILALTLAALMQLFSSGLRGTDAADRHLMAAMLARSVLDDVGAEIPLVEGEQSADVEQGYRWTVRIRPSSAIAPVAVPEWTATLYDVQVAITWNDRSVAMLTSQRLGIAAASVRGGAAPAPQQ